MKKKMKKKGEKNTHHHHHHHPNNNKNGLGGSLLTVDEDVSLLLSRLILGPSDTNLHAYE